MAVATTLAIRVWPEAVRTATAAAITTGAGSYIGLGTSFANPIHWFYLQNFTDKDLMFSWDGINDHFPLPAGGYIIMDVTSNKTVMGGSFMIAKGTRFYVKYFDGAPTAGKSVYLATFYGQQ